MSREIRRVPLDFAWPLRTVWSGYLPPHVPTCPDCEYGETVARRYVDAIASQLSCIGGDAARGDRVHPSVACHPFPGVVAGKDAVELTTGLAGRPPSSMGHDSSDCWRMSKAIIRAAGLDPDTWGICPRCKGHGVEPEYQAILDAFVETEPPTGEGWQVWETVSEGSPITPVLPTRETFVAWLQQDHPECRWSSLSQRGAEAFVGAGFVMSLIVAGRGVETGLEHIDRIANESAQP